MKRLLLSLSLLSTLVLASSVIGPPGAGGGGSGDVTGPGASDDDGLVLFDGTDGDAIKQATGSGVVKSVSGVADIGPLVNADVDAAAAIDATKLVDGSVSNAELQFINTLSSNAQTQITARLPLAGGTMTGDLVLAGDPTLDLHAATKAYVDAVAQGLKIKNSVVAATTVAGTLASDFENGDTIDGVVLATGNRLLVKNQAAPAENGIYVVAASGAPTRSTDADTWDELVDAFVFVSGGTVNEFSGWAADTDAGGTLNTTAIPFNQFSQAGALTTDGEGVEMTGSELALELDGATLSKSASGLKLADLPDGDILVGNGSDVATAVTMTGDVTISNAGVTTIGANEVANSQLAQIDTARFKGRTSGGTGNVEDLTATQATALLNAVVGDSGSGGTKGLVPAPASGDAHKFLTGAGTFASPTASDEITNVGLTASVASNSLTVALKQAGGSDCSATSPCLIGFRNATATNGQYVQRSVTGALSVAAAAGENLGTVAGIVSRIHVVAVDTGSGVVLGLVNDPRFDENGLVSTVAFSGSGDIRGTLFTTAGQASKPVRFIGSIDIEGTASNWTVSPASVNVIGTRVRKGIPVMGRDAVPKIGIVELNCDTGSAVTSDPDNMVASIGNQSGANCSGTFTDGYWSATPMCVAQATTSAKISQATTSSTTAFIFRMGDDDAGAASTGDGIMLCVGQ